MLNLAYKRNHFVITFYLLNNIRVRPVIAILTTELIIIRRAMDVPLPYNDVRLGMSPLTLPFILIPIVIM